MKKAMFLISLVAIYAFGCGEETENGLQNINKPEAIFCHLSPSTIMNGDYLTIDMQYLDWDGDITEVCFDWCCNDNDLCSDFVCNEDNAGLFRETFGIAGYTDFYSLGYCLDSSKQTIHMKLIDSQSNESDVISCSVNLTNTTNTCEAYTNNLSNIKIYFTEPDCAGVPYTNYVSTKQCSVYTTQYEDSTGYLRTTSVKLKSYVASVVDEGTGTCVPEENLYDLWMSAWTDPITNSCMSYTEVGNNVKIYFTSPDCSGAPYTYAPLTNSCSTYQTSYTSSSGHLRTTNIRVTRFIPSVVHAGTTDCSGEGATYDLWEAEWYTP